MGNHPLTLYARSNKFKPNSVVVITGATSGMGRELAIRYAERGCNIVITSRSLPELKKIAESLNAKYEKAHVVPFVIDVTIESDSRRLIDYTVRTFGRIDILILNASATMPRGLFENIQDIAAVQKLMDINLYGQIYPTNALPYLKETHGQLVISSTLAGEIGLLERSGYCASKFAATGFFEALRMEVGKQIDITILCPPSVVVEGNVDSEIIIQQREIQANEDNTLISNRITSEPTSQEDRYIEGAERPKQLTRAVDMVMMGIDTRMKKLLFPQDTWLAIMARPFVPDIVDSMILSNRAKL